MLTRFQKRQQESSSSSHISPTKSPRLYESQESSFLPVALSFLTGPGLLNIQASLQACLHESPESHLQFASPIVPEVLISPFATFPTPASQVVLKIADKTCYYNRDDI